MSDAAGNRRYGDPRMNKLEKTVDGMREDLSLVKQKIFNGFSDSIKNTEDKINRVDEHNTEAHKMLNTNIDKLSGKFDKMIWLWLSGSVTIIIGVVIFVIKGSI